MARQRPTCIPTPHLVMGPCIVEIERIVIREVRYQLDVNRCRIQEIIVKVNFGWAWPMLRAQVEIDRIVIRELQYQFEVNRCRNEEFIVKGNFGRARPIWAGRPRVGNEAMHKVNRYKNEEIIVKGNFGWAWPMWAWPMWEEHPRIIRIVIREVQYQFEDIRVEEESGQDERTDRRTDGRLR
ncbi:hypothetical protein DPMN_046454 [Dreissena polymorpha]|uniref:Uncharacterized protein n=1 Tax=Dreissena polymorpha TaxID=45954 RepID=A0A9D4D7W3_DREPO|nr:hypothetical protein DPMN_046454 [Dreissena polymorpha]